MRYSDIKKTGASFTRSLPEKINRLLKGPLHPENDFIVSQLSYQKLYGLADSIRSKISDDCPAVLLCTEDKGLLAASVLAALSSRFTLVLPYAGSASAVADVQNKTGISTAVTDGKQELPKGISPLKPEADLSKTVSLKPAADLNTPFLNIYTGGSTGAPKVWSKTPVNLFAEAFFQAEQYRFTPADRVLSTVAPCHIYGLLYSVLVPLVSSASVIPEICTYPEEIRRALKTASPTVFVSVPVHYRLLNSGSIPGDSLRIAFSSAGRLAPEDGDYFYEVAGVELCEIYGSTETGGIADRCRAAGETDLTVFDIVEWKMDIHDRLCVRSPFISPELEKDDAGFFVTGDRAAIGPKGRMVLKGRADSIVKVGGRRVDLESLKEAFKGIEGVEDAVLLSAPGHSARENDILALIQGRISENWLKEAARKCIEPYAMPRRIRIVEQIPVSSSGKYNHEAVIAFFEDKKNA